MTKEQYEDNDYRNINKDFALDTVNIIKEYIDNGYDLIGIIGM